MNEPTIVCVPKELYYHEVAYVRGLEAKLASAKGALERIRKQDRVTIYRGTEQQSYEDGPCGQIARTTLSSIKEDQK